MAGSCSPLLKRCSASGPMSLGSVGLELNGSSATTVIAGSRSTMALTCKSNRHACAYASHQCSVTQTADMLEVICWCRSAPTQDRVFPIRYLRKSSSTELGTTRRAQRSGAVYLYPCRCTVALSSHKLFHTAAMQDRGRALVAPQVGRQQGTGRSPTDTLMESGFEFTQTPLYQKTVALQHTTLVIGAHRH